jgi:hypothetical protein
VKVTRQGCSTLVPDEQGRILDRLAGLEKMISPELRQEVLAATGKQNGRGCPLTHEVMLRVVLAMGLFTHLPIRQVFRHSRRCRSNERTPCRSALCAARKRLGVEPLKELFSRVAKPLATLDTPGAFYRGLRLVSIDGSVFDVPDSEANASFGRSSGSRGDSAFPQVRKVSLVESGTHVEIAMVVGGWSDSEKSLVQQLWNEIPEDALVIEDRGFFSYDTWKTLYLRRKLLMRAMGHMVLTPIVKLSDGSFLAKIYRCSDDRKYDRRGIVVRVIEYILDDPQRTGHGEVHRLITNLLDETTYPALELIEIYHERWEQEIVYDEQKTHQDPRRAEKASQLRSETPNGVRQELYALSLAHYTIRKMMFDAAQEAQLDVDRLSFTGCFRILQCRLPECHGTDSTSLSGWYQRLLLEMREEIIPERRNRINPRVIKRKMSKWMKKRPCHRRPVPLRKSFIDTVVMKT